MSGQETQSLEGSSWGEPCLKASLPGTFRKMKLSSFVLGVGYLARLP